MNWWLILGAVIVAALAYGYWDHTKQSRRLAKLFAVLAAKYGGQVKAANLLALPQLRFERGGRRFLVTAMANSGAHVGASGPFTLVDVELPFDSGHKIRVERNAVNPSDATSRLIESTSSGDRPTTSREAFEQAFRIEGGDEGLASQLLDARVRDKLLQSRLPRLDARVDSRKVVVHMDGFAEETAELEELIDIAQLLADRCPGRD